VPTILCFGDSNTWGFIPGTGERFAPDVRWPGVLGRELGADARVVEEGLSGRTAAVVDLVRPHLTALPYLLPALESHAPLDAIVFMLGTNDVQDRYTRSAGAVASDVLGLAEIAARSGCGARGDALYVLLVAPPPIASLPDPLWAAEYGTGVEKSRELPRLLEAAAASGAFGFVDAGRVTRFSEDGIHLDAAGHAALGAAVADALRTVLAESG